jgi:predicted anti-sigma-YlaC factor YlaD
VTCEECFERLDELVELELGGGVAGQRLRSVRAHLDGCRECRERYESLRALLLADADAERG